jgi:putative Holliday junction resolvase
MRCLGVDFGDKKTGIALGDSVTRICAPLMTLKTELVISKLKELVNDEGIEMVVVGLPLFADGQRSKQTEKTENFAKLLSEFVRVELIDERFTSAESRQLQELGDVADEDSLAAMLILEAYFNQLK